MLGIFSKHWETGKKEVLSSSSGKQTHTHISTSIRLECNLSDNWACILLLSKLKFDTLAIANTYSTWCAWRLNEYRRPENVWVWMWMKCTWKCNCWHGKCSIYLCADFHHRRYWKICLGIINSVNKWVKFHGIPERT